MKTIKNQNALLTSFVFFLFLNIVGALSIAEAFVESPFQYEIFGQYNENGFEYSKFENNYTYVQLDSVFPEYVWGNIRIDYDNTDKVECISIEEPPDSLGLLGFWTWWTNISSNTGLGGGGALYHYSDGGGEWAQEWTDSGYGNATPGSIDISSGSIFMYVSTPAGDPSYSMPLRLGFRLKDGVNTPVSVTFSVSNNNWINFIWFPEDLTFPEEYIVTLLPDLPPVIPAVIDIKPDTIKSKSKGKKITVYIEVPDNDITLIDISSVTLNNTVHALLKPTSYGDYDLDGNPDLMLKFRILPLADIPSDYVTFKVSGLIGGDPFEGEDIVRIIK